MQKQKVWIISIMMACLLCACGSDVKTTLNNENETEEKTEEKIEDSTEDGKKSVADGESNDGNEESYEPIRENSDENSAEKVAFYPSYDPSWTEEELIKVQNERGQYYRASAYYSEIIDYWENVRGVKDTANVMEPLFETDKKYYTKKEFENEPSLVIHLAKNEIYARHGYIFTNEDLQNYFMGCMWYSPTCEGKDFDDSVLNEYEKKNLEILVELDV